MVGEQSVQSRIFAQRLADESPLDCAISSSVAIFQHAGLHDKHFNRGEKLTCDAIIPSMPGCRKQGDINRAE